MAKPEGYLLIGILLSLQLLVPYRQPFRNKVEHRYGDLRTCAGYGVFYQGLEDGGMGGCFSGKIYDPKANPRRLWRPRRQWNRVPIPSALW